VTKKHAGGPFFPGAQFFDCGYQAFLKTDFDEIWDA